METGEGGVEWSGVEWSGVEWSFGDTFRPSSLPLGTAFLLFFQISG